ncbi:hypothetical protein [Methylobacterium pseudosasicola]|uniref:Helix-turn-helix domain-containing protein n=1 Tax=Methylobacterium pseudosasicola TaxID=582667 RepID=A0A1I4USV0_9HYPH|nr:hypothetical protein [Methylobacterium pseudosasicola]SFM91998.1 hypothetical protein SAMN05192568_107611 [Methylobacterium pseudosasicola]
MPEQVTSAAKPSIADDIAKVMREAVIDPETYGRLLQLGRGATYRALAKGVPIEPIRAGKAFRIPTPPLRRLLQLDGADTAAA